MELIFILARFFQYLFIAPIWWLSSGLAAMIFPFEGDNRHSALALVIASLLSAAIIGLIVYFSQ